MDCRLYKNKIIDSEGNTYTYDHERVCHVFTADCNVYLRSLLRNLFLKRGWNFRICNTTNENTLNDSKKLCSGRECLPFCAISGHIWNDYKNHRKENEITIYYNLNQEGPCQVGGWPEIWKNFSDRYNLTNAVFINSLGIDNNYMGEGEWFSLELGACIVISDLLDEAEMSLRCVAENPEEALKEFNIMTDEFINQISVNILHYKKTLRAWSYKMQKIKKKANPSKLPKVLLFGGLNILFLHTNIRDFFINQGIIPKLIEQAEGISHVESEYGIRYGFKRGKLTPSKQLNLISLLFSMFNPMYKLSDKIKATRSIIHVKAIYYLQKKFRKIADNSGLLFDKDTNYIKLLEEGHQYLNYNSMSESAGIIGKYITAIQHEIFDGLIFVGAYNCQPGLNALSIIQSHMKYSSIPIISLEMENGEISESNKRMLETIAYQVKNKYKN